MYCSRVLSFFAHKLRLEDVYCFAVDISDFLLIHSLYSTHEMSFTSKYLHE
jgi:hypothetical protein